MPIHHVDVAVIGRGMIGSAAARHLGATAAKVALIGPTEPDTHDGDGPWASHWDQGRVTRITAFSEPWGEWARAAIDRYPEIEASSGVTFHDPVGLVVLADDAAATMAAAERLGADVEAMTPDELRTRTGIHSAVPTHSIVWEGAPAGLINPRALVRAQTICAEQAGVTVIDDAVVRIDHAEPGRIHLRSGEIVDAAQIILATGPHGADLVPGIDAPLERRMRTIALAELGPGPDLPTLIIDNPPHALLDEAYWVPPVEFPDGRMLLKIGGDSLPPQLADDGDDITRWFHAGGSEAEATALFELLETLLPEREITRVRHRPCVVSYTPSGIPHLERVSPSITLAFGGCGAAAKSCDEIGRIAADIAIG
jgi:sarcosine oxidase